MRAAAARGEAVLTMPNKPLLLCYDGSENAKHAIREAAGAARAAARPRAVGVAGRRRDPVAGMGRCGASRPGGRLAAARDGAERMAEEGAGIARATGFDADRHRRGGQGADLGRRRAGRRGARRGARSWSARAGSAASSRSCSAACRAGSSTTPRGPPSSSRRQRADYGRRRRLRPDDARPSRAGEGAPEPEEDAHGDRHQDTHPPQGPEPGTLDFLQRALEDLNRPAACAADAQSGIDDATERIRAAADDVRKRLREEADELQRRLEHASEEARVELGLVAIRAQRSPRRSACSPVRSGARRTAEGCDAA